MTKAEVQQLKKRLVYIRRGIEQQAKTFGLAIHKLDILPGIETSAEVLDRAQNCITLKVHIDSTNLDVEFNARQLAAIGRTLVSLLQTASKIRIVREKEE